MHYFRMKNINAVKMGFKKDKEQVSIENVREKLYERYNAELGQLWQHSIMAWGFELLIFTGYGYLIANFFLKCSGSCIFYHNLNLIALGLCFLGLCVSAMWIALVKAAKTRQESSEEVIHNLERDPDFFPYSRVYAMGGFHNRVKKLDMSLRTGNPGKFSPSRLNMFIGQFTWFVWASLSLVHIILLGKCPLCIIVELVILICFYIGFNSVLREKCENKKLELETFGRGYIIQRFELVMLLLSNFYSRMPTIFFRVC